MVVSNFELMAKPILLYTPFFEDTAEKITNQILDYKRGEDIEFWMNSPGGSVSAGYTIINSIKENGNEFNTTVLGDASSMAFIWLLFSKKRRAYNTSNFLVHRAASWWESIMNEEELKEVEKRNEVIREQLEEGLNEKKFKEVTGHTFDDIFSMDGRLDVKLNAQQAKDIGLIDEIIQLDVAQREEIESRYFNDIAALAQPVNNNSNINKSKMGKLTDLIFGEKDPILVASIGENQVVYGKLEKGAKIKAIGKDSALISGTFEAEEKTITVVENEITAVTELDKKQKEIDSLSAKVKDLEANQVTADDVKEVVEKLQEKHSTEMADLKAILDKAKITASSPDLPKGDFDDKIVQPIEEKDYRIKKSIEAKAAEKQKQRDLKLKKGGI